MREPNEGLAVNAPKASGYDFQTSGVVKMLEKLLNEFIAERTTLEKEELNTKQAYEMEGQKLRGPSNLSASQRKKLRARKPMKT